MAGRGNYWETSFRSSEKLRDEERASEAGGDPCSRDIHCSGRRIVAEGGERRIVPARTYGPFCPSCQGLIATCLSELPAAYVRLGEEIPEPHRRGAAGHVPFGPKLPFDASYDLVQRAIAEILASWTERVRTIARLSVLDTQLSRRRDQVVAVAEHAAVLAAHLTALLALQAEPMMRSVPVRSHVAPDSVTMLLLSGQDAGEEILRLHRDSLTLLGEIVRQREVIDGVPCRRCESMSLYRAEPPSDPDEEVPWSECRECRDRMSSKTFQAWAAMYSRWAESSGVACKRCSAGRCAECQWNACACAACDHAAA